MENNITTFGSIDALSHFFGEQLVYGIHTTSEEDYFSIALSGGSTPRVVFQYLALHFKDKINWKKLFVFWGDERCVPPKSNESNFKMAHESLLDHVPIPAGNIHRIRGEANPPDEAKRYAEVLQKQLRFQNGTPRFDLIMLGLGDDGHTASIFPGSEHLFNSEAFCEVAQHPESLQKRITISGKIINGARMVVFLATGKSKAHMLGKLLRKQEGSEKLPAAMVRPTNGKLLWLLDDDAATLLKHKTEL